MTGKARAQVDAVIACAMEEELAPFLAAASQVEEALQPCSAADPQRFYLATLAGSRVLLVRSGIGLTNAASAATRALENYSTPLFLIAGTTGGLPASVNVRDVVAGTSTRYFDADATAFGYQPGQIPQMPALYESEAPTVPTMADHVGEVISGNSFITAENVGDARTRFPGALAVDMETAAVGQVCHIRGIPWLSLRAVSDLCGPLAGQEFHVEVETAARLSCEAVMEYIRSHTAWR